MNRRRRLAISSEHMECRLVLSPTGLADPHVALNASDDAAGNDSDDADRPADDGRTQQRFEQRSRPATKHEATHVKAEPSDPQSTPSDDRKFSPAADRTPPPETSPPPQHVDRPTSDQQQPTDPLPSTTPPPSKSNPPADSTPTATNSDTAPTATDPARNDEPTTASDSERTRDPAPRQPPAQTTSPEQERTPATDSTTNTERDVVSAERNEVTAPTEPAPTEERTLQSDTWSPERTSASPTTSPETNRKESDTRTVATTDVGTLSSDHTTAEPQRIKPETTRPTNDATRGDDTAVKVRPVKTEDQSAAVRPVNVSPANDATVAARPVPTEATNTRTVDDFTTPAVIATETETLSRVSPDTDASTAKPSMRTIGDELNRVGSDTVKKVLNETTTAAVAKVDPATAVAAVVVAANSETRLAPSINDRVEHLLPIAEPALPSNSVLPKATFNNASTKIVYVSFPSTSDTTVDQNRMLLGELLSSSTALRADVVASQTLFADATRLGLMLAAVSHAGRRSGSMLAFSDVLDDPGNNGSLHNQERRRRRTFGGRRLPTPRSGSQRRRDPLETIEERTSIPASPSCDVLFADAAMMSVLFHEAEQRSSGSSRWNQTTVLGGLAAGTGGLAARRARQMRRRKAANVRPQPPQPRHNGKTLVFAD